ncbi:MAG TPA: YhdP family protein [Gammaproteobacteria bacterium]
MSARPTLLKRIVRTLLASAAVVIIVVALAIGALRIALTRLPSYQAELEQWAAESLGIGLDFERLDARLGLSGPEITFHGASVRAPGEAEPFFVARRAAVVLDAWALVTSRALRAKRVTFEGTDFTLLRREDGRLDLERAPRRGGGRDLALLLPPELAVAVRDSRVTYVDPARGVRWAFRDVALDLERGGGTLELEARARPPDGLGTRAEVAVQGDFGPGGGWRVFGDVTDADLAGLAAALPELPVRPESGHGDATVWLEWSDRRFVRGMLDASFANVAWHDGVERRYERLGASAEWLRTASGWRIALNDVEIARGGRAWAPNADTVIELEWDGGSALDAVRIDSTFVRLEDLVPLAALGRESAWARRFTELAPRGDLTMLDLDLSRDDDGYEYSVSARFADLGIAATARAPGFAGLSGELRADSTSGRVAFDTHDARLDWPALFRAAIDVRELSGLIVWRAGADGVTIVSDDLVMTNADGTVRSSLELTLPRDGGSATLDLASHVGAFDAVAAKRYFPVHKMPPKVVEWLDDSIQGGRVTSAALEFVGPLRAFPFDGGEGRFRVAANIEDAILGYAREWPRAENLDGVIEFVNASFSARGSGRVLGNVGDDVRVGIADLRRPVLTLESETRGPLGDVLAFLKSAPPIARQLGPGYDRVDAPAGEGRVTFALALPLLDMSTYSLEASLAIANGTLAIDGLGPAASEIAGTLEFRDGVVTAERIDAIFLDGPVTARVSPPGLPGYRSRIDVEGEVTAGAVVAAFGAPLDGLAGGQTRWRGSVLLPVTADGGEAPPLRINVSSNLSGLALYLPEPFNKAAGEPTGLELELALGASGLDVRGYVGATRRFVLSMVPGDDGFELEGAALALGGALPVARADGGLGVYGTVPELDFDAWAALVRPATGRTASGAGLAESGLGEIFAEAELDIGDFTAFGQQIGAARLEVRRTDAEWLIDIASAPVDGSIRVPRDLRGRPAIVADLDRLFLMPHGGGDVDGERDGVRAAALRRADPRRLLGLDLTADEFGVGARRFGTLRADVRSDPLGLRLESFESRSASFAVTGSGGWFAGPDGQTTRLAFNLHATDVAGALEELSLEPIASGEIADITASVWWPGAPTDDWMAHLGGDLSLRLETGSLLDIDPGAGRVVGLMSITALPRRLALDFRDVFNKGFGFDTLSGDFTIIDGNAYTDNLKVTGPVAEIGVAGRIGLRDRDYRQQAVVTTEPGKVLPTVGGLLGGPGVGAALLIFTRIFKEPLKGIGRASYCVTGSWDAPSVERLTAEQLEQGRLCADLPGAASGGG